MFGLELSWNLQLKREIPEGNTGGRYSREIPEGDAGRGTGGGYRREIIDRDLKRQREGPPRDRALNAHLQLGRLRKSERDLFV